MANRRVDGESYWRGMVKEWSQSGVSQRRFCDRKKIGYPNFCYWRRRLAEGEDSKRVFEKSRLSPAKPFIPVEVRPSVPLVSASAYEVILESGHRLRVPLHFEPDSLGRLLEILKRHLC